MLRLERKTYAFSVVTVVPTGWDLGIAPGVQSTGFILRQKLHSGILLSSYRRLHVSKQFNRN